MTSKLIKTGLVLTAMLVAPFAANAADLRAPTYKAPAYVAPLAPSWTGFYVGLNAGYGFGTADFGAVELEPSGFVAGGTIGYNLQTGSWVWGIEADIAYSNLNDSFGALEADVNWLGTARGRIGYAGWGSMMPYITGGAAFGDIEASVPGFSDSEMGIGWTAGVGLEYMVWSNWSVKFEYLYADLGTVTLGGTDVDFTTHLVRAGLNYRF
jgi:outer membrane immunogenic protein